MLDRRELLASVASLAALGAAGASQSSEPGERGLDLDDPAENLRAFVKLTGSLGHDRVYDLIKGRVYALVPGESARPLFKTIGAGHARYSRRSTLEYSAISRYVGFLLDWDTEQVLRQWTNPYTGAVCEVPVTSYGPGETRIFSDRIVAQDAAPKDPPDGVRPWFRLGDVIHMQRDVILPAPALPHFPKADLMTYSGDWAELADPGLASASSRLSFTAVETWRPWMGMDGGSTSAGALWWQVAGVKLAGPEQFAPHVRAQLLAADASFFD